MTSHPDFVGYSKFFIGQPELPVMLNDKEYENSVGIKCDDEGGYYKNGYSVLEGYEKIYIKVYTILGGVVAIEEEIAIDTAADKVVRYRGYNNTDFLPFLKEGEMEEILTSLIKRRIKRSIDIYRAKLVKDMEEADALKVIELAEDIFPSLSIEEPVGGYLCEECGEGCDPHNQMDGHMKCPECELIYTQSFKEGLCEDCLKVDEACQC
tara:strand:- start:1004 stop:1630 length:627 start_codon:yes stop_codon:yes gene_type:complete